MVFGKIHWERKQTKRLRRSFSKLKILKDSWRSHNSDFRSKRMEFPKFKFYKLN